MRKLTAVAVFLFLSLSLLSIAWAQGVKCVNADGEAVIVDSDIPSAKMEAVSRAKWAAIEKVVGVNVKAGTMVQNFIVFDDAIKSETTGVVKSYEILNQNSDKGLYHVDLKACVEPSKAQKAVSALALNNQLAVFIPARKPRETGGRGEYEENNILSETLIGKLIDQGYQVIDIASTNMADARTIERAVATGNTANLRGMLYKSLSNLLIIGKVDYVISTRKGQDIGYGISMPFNNVTIRFNYRIVAKNSKTGNTEILASGVEQGRALANAVEDAVANAMRDVAENFAPTLLEKISRYVQGSMKRVSVSVAGITDLDTNMETRNILQNIVWVAGVEEQSMGKFVVSYPENSLYLANSIKQKGKYKLVNFTQYSIVLELEK